MPHHMRSDHEPTWLCVPKFCARYIVLGWLLSPIYILNCVVQYMTCQCKQFCEFAMCCGPLKARCNANGANRAHKLYLPWGILDWAAFILGALPVVFMLKTAKIPYAFISKSALMAENVTMTRAGNALKLGDYENHYKRIVLDGDKEFGKLSVAMAYSMFDQDLLQEWSSHHPTSQGVNNASYIDSSTAWLNFTSKMHPDLKPANKPSSLDDLIIMNHKCVCNGIMLDDISSCPAGYCKPVKALSDFADIPATLIGAMAALNGNTGLKLFGFVGFLCALARVVAIVKNPKILQIPGNQFMCGFWSFVCFFMFSRSCDKILNGIKAAQASENGGFQYYSNENRFVGGIPGPYFQFYMNAGSETDNFTVHLLKAQKFAKIAAFVNFLLCFVSEWAYCPDCTPLIYAEDNLKLHRKRSSYWKKMAFQAGKDEIFDDDVDENGRVKVV